MILFSFSLTWDHMGEKVSNDISSESKHKIHSLYNPAGGSLLKWLKDLLNYQILIYFFWHFFFCVV